MCLIGLAWQQHADMPLIVIANRDEFYHRPSNNLHLWPNNSRILAGKDLQAGGTWMGCTPDGRWAAVTNVRDGQRTSQTYKSRGELISRYLENKQTPNSFIEQLFLEANHYDGFNLLLGTKSELHYFSNKPLQHQQLQAGVYGLSNAQLDSNWPKVNNIKTKLKQAISQTDICKKSLFKILQNTEQAKDHQLPNTGIPSELEKTLSSNFIRTENYGTRCSSIFMLRVNHIEFHEVSAANKLTKTQERVFRIAYDFDF